MPPWHPDHNFVVFNDSAAGGGAAGGGGAARGGVDRAPSADELDAARAAFASGRAPLFYEVRKRTGPRDRSPHRLPQNVP